METCNNTASSQSESNEKTNDRNIIKKIKTFCMNILVFMLQKCVEDPKVFCLYNIKNKHKRKIFRAFKSDISKVRNLLILPLSIGTILDKFTNIIWDRVSVKKEMEVNYKFLINMTWEELILFCKRKSYESIFKEEENKSTSKVKKTKFVNREIPNEHFNDYLNYVKHSENVYGSRLNVDKNYLKIYEEIEELFKNVEINKQNKEDLNLEMELELDSDLMQFLNLK